MHDKRKLFFILILVLIILSMSFVSAADNITGDVGGETVLSVTDDTVVDENVDDNSVEESGSVLGLADNQSDENESEDNLADSDAQVLGASNVEELDDNENVKIVTSNDAQVLSVPNNEPVLNAPNILNFYDNQHSTDDIRNAIRDATGPTIIYLNGGTYNGRINFDIGDQFPWWQNYDDNYRKNKKVDLTDIKIIGGSQSNPNQKAAINPLNSWENAFNFIGYHEPIEADPDHRSGYFSTSGYNLINFEIINITSKYRFFNIAGGSMDNCVIDGCTSVTQFFNAVGNYHDNTQMLVKNCNFTNCQQTSLGEDYVKDGSGQLGAVFGLNMVGCNFINTSSAQHGGALCIADESEWGSARIATTLYNCSFINVTSRWFAIYIHGNFRTSFDSISSPEIIDNCKFINCIGTGEYSGAIGISHDDLIVRNSEFVNCSGGQGAAIMVGGIDPDHDGFSGRNTKGNNVTIDNCTFTNNVANLTKTSSYCNGIYKWESYLGNKDHSKYKYYNKLGENYYVEDWNGEYYNKHEPITFYPTGNAGAVYVFGNDTKILNCKFNENIAENNGGAIYILGHRTLVNNSEFYNQECNNGTIYIKGNNATIKDCKFEDNHAIDGSAIYIEGMNTLISNTTFKDNNGTNGTVYIKGDNTKIVSGSKFNDNNASYGGGIYILGKNTEISASAFNNNNATNDGGGIYIKGDNTQIKDSSSFTENYAAHDGGGIYLGGTNTEISATNFIGNNATHDGGGIYVRGNNTKAIAGSNFTENHANHDGGGMYVEGMNTLISDSYFERNDATYGAGMYIKGNKTNITSGSKFIENQAVNGAGAYLEGSNTLVSGSVFERNNATQGGGMYIKGSNTNITSKSNFTQNNASDGAGVFIEGSNTNISDSNFEKNNATHDGAGMYVSGSNTRISDSDFEKNNASNNGGGMFISGDNTKIVSGSDFSENYAVNGAGMYIEGKNTEIQGSTFDSNNATTEGGGMYIKGNNTNITSNSRFIGNNATNGGGMYIEGSNTEVIGSTFEKNNATCEGGGMYIKGNNTKITQGSDFTQNYATNGSGMYIEGSDTLVSGSKFEKNNATQNGGGMFISGNRTKVRDNSDFSENNATNGGGMYITGSNTEVLGSKFDSNNATDGAGMYITGNNTKVLSGSYFTENYAAHDGAGMYIDGMNTLVSGSKFEKNNATQNGGGMYISGNNTNVTDNSDFIENYATNGGGMYIDGMNTLVSGSKFEKNNATQNGGGMYISGNNTNITSKSNFTENYAFNGGGVYIDGGNTSISGSNFINNHATNGAGGFIDGSDTKISDSTFTVNEADNGAGIYVEGKDTEISKSTFTENTAVNGSGAYVDGKNTRILNSNFTFNDATNGAGMYVKGTDTEISKSTFKNNDATNGAGGFVDGENTQITDSIFEVNTAVNGSGIYVKGKGTKINKSNFTNNSADNGAGAFVDGENTAISDSIFTINNATTGAGFYVDGVGTEIIRSNFTNNSAVNGAGGYVEGKDTKILDSNFTINNATNGAGIYVNGTHTEINNSTFDHNTACDGAGGYVNGDDTKIIDSTFEINNATKGAGFYVSGTNTKVLNTIFDSNNATDGAGGYVNGSDTNITSNSTFKNNRAVNGAGIYVNGARTNIKNTTFDGNNATNGGGAYIKGSDTKILNSTFIKNNVTYHGGAVYIDGSASEFRNNNFTYNEAVPDNTVSELSGLGGAIFVKGDNTYTYANDFEHNKARNGSAIYSSGTNFKLENDIFRENQAWSYLLVTVAEPVASYYNTKDVKIEVVHIGGDNMINAIHNNASFDQISLKNVSYIRSSPDNISGKTYTTNATEFEQPVDGVENSQNGTKLYQDDREYLQNITINVTYENTTVSYTFYSSLPNNGRGLLSAPLQNRGAGNNNQIAYWEGLTNLYGDVYLTLPKASLKVGEYNVTATHPEDWNYKYILNSTRFAILPYVDLSVDKTSDKFEYFDDDIAVWTITVHNANNASNATNVVLDDLLPSEFEFINASATQGSYDNHTGKWTIGNMTNGSTVTLTIHALVESDVERMDHFAHIESNEGKVILDVQRVTEKDSYKMNDNAIWNFTVTNNGPVAAHNVNITHLFPFEFEFREIIEQSAGVYNSGVATGEWFIDSIASGQTVTLKLKTIATADDDEISNLVNVDYTEKHQNLTVKKESDKEEYHADHIAYFTITITNNNGCNATNVILNDVLQPEFEFNGTYTATRGEYNSTTNKWTIPELKEGEHATLNIYSHTVIIRGNVTNYAEVSCSEGEWNYTNNYANRTVEVVPLPLPTKSVSNITPNYHDYIEYNLTIYNTGNTTYKKNLTITDTLPVGLDFIEFVSITGADLVNQTNSSGASVNHIVDGRKVKWIITNITNKTSAVITVKLQVNGLGKLVTNTSVINSIYNLDNDNELYNKLIDLTNNVTFMKKLFKLTGNSTFIKSIVNLTNAGSTFSKLIELVNNKTYVDAIGTLTNATFKNALIGLTANSVGINSTGNLTNNLTVTGPNGTNVTDRCTVYPNTFVDISVNITSDKDEYYVDDIAVWTITVSNAANGTNATNVTLKDLFPIGQFRFINCTLANGSSFTGDVWYIGDLANGTNVTFTVYTLAIAPGIAEHNVTVSCNETEWNYTNNKANKTVNVVVLPYPVKTVNNDTPYYNDIIEYNITIVNEGRFNYTNILNVTDSLPDGLLFNGTYKVVGADNISFVDGGQTLTWRLTNITEDNATITLWAKVVGLGDKIIRNSTFIAGNVTTDSAVKYVGNLTNNVTVTGPNGTKKYDNCTVYAIPIVDLKVNITSDKDEYFIDDIAVWTINVSNAANGTNATNVTLKELFPSDKFEFINCTDGTNWFYSLEDFADIGFMGNGTNVTFTLYTLAIAPGVAEHNVTVSSNETEWNYTNNRANKTVNVVVLPYPVKTVNNDTPYYNDIIEYNITIVNEGRFNYTNILNVTDSLPDGLLFNGTYKVVGADNISFVDGGQTLTWRLTNITEDNATITLWAKVVGLGDKIIRNSTFIAGNVTTDSAVKYVGNLTNNVTVTGPNGTKKYDNCTVYAIPIVDLKVNITSDKDEYFIDDIAVWTINVSNAANGTNATNVTLKELFPSDKFEFINCTDGTNWFYSLEDFAEIGFMGNGTNVTFTVYSRAVANGTADYAVSVSCNETDWNLTNNEDNKTVNVVILPYPVKTVSNITPNYHDVIEYNLTIVNVGTTDYTGILNVTDSLPAGLIYNGTYDIKGAKEAVQFVNNNNQTLSWFITNITRNSNATITLYVKVIGLGEEITDMAEIGKIRDANDKRIINRLGNLTNNLTVTGPNGTNKTVNCTVYPVPIVDVAVNITSDKDEYFIDDIAVWTINVSNAANGTDATNVTLNSVFPSDKFEFINCTNGTHWFYSPDDFANIGFMGNGTNVTFTVYSRAVANGTADYKVSVSCNETDWNLTNNEDNKTVNVVPLPYPVKTVNNNTPYYNDVIAYNLTIVNPGTTDYTNNLTVVDVLPDGLLFNGTFTYDNVVVLVNETDGHKFTWNITNIPGGKNATITVYVKVVGLGDKIIRDADFIANNVTKDSAVRYVGNLTNNVTVTGPNGTVKSDNCTVYPVPIVDLSVNKTSDKDEYFVGDEVVWTIIVSNARNGTDATNVTLKDLIPAQFEVTGCSTANGTYNAKTGIWYIDFMGNGTVATLIINSIAKTVITNITNVAVVTSNETDWNKTNNDDNVTVVIVPHPIKTVNNDTPYYHEIIEYNLTIVNNGDANYTNVLNVTDSLPTGLDFVGNYTIVGADEISMSLAGRVFTWMITNVTNKNATITVWVKVNGVGELINNVTVSTPNGTNRSDDCTVNPMTLVDISVNITSDKDEYFVDDVAVFTITVSNAKNGTNASNINLSEFIPKEFEYMYYDPVDGTVYNETTHVWTIPTLANGTDVTLKVYAHAKIPVSNTTNKVNASCSDKEWNYTNNRDNVTVEIVAFHRPVKVVSNSTPYYHEYVNYTMTVENLGNNTYTSNFTVIDTLPVGLEFIRTLNITGATNLSEVHKGQVITWNLTNIKPKSNATIVIMVKVNAIGDLTNNLTVVGPRNSTDMVNCTINPMPIVDLKVNVTSNADEYFVDDIAVWTITVYNANNGTNATNVTLKDLFPYDNFEFINCTPGCDYNSTTGVWTIGFMGNGTNVTINITSRAKQGGINITYNVTVSCNEDEWNTTNNDDNITVDVYELPHPVKTVNNSIPYYNDVIEYNLTIVNDGAIKYVDVLNVTDSLPVGLRFIDYKIKGANEARAYVNVNNQTVTWFVTNITAGSNATITVRVKVAGIGERIYNSTFIANNVTKDPAVKYVGNLTNNMTVTGPRGTNETVNCTVYPIPLVDISVNITSDKDEYFVDDVAVFTITVSNAANASNASNIKLNELIPKEFEFMYSSDDVAYNNTTGVWSIPALANGTDITLEIYAHAKIPASNITNKVNATCDEKEWNYTNNRDNVTVEIVAFHRPVKVVSNSTPYYHEYVNYTMTVENLGNNTYTSNFTVIDSLPAGLEFIETLSITGATNLSEVHNGQNITWILTNIKPKSNATIVVLVKVNAIGNLTNNLTVVGPRNSTDMVNCTINPMTLVDLTVNITSDKDEYFVDDVAVFTITVSNAANGTNASNIKLSELLPKEFEFMYSSDDVAYNNTTGVWSIPALANGTDITLEIYAHAKTPANNITNKVNVSCSDKEWNYTNNDDSVTVEIVAFHRPVKVVSNSTPYYHEYVNYTMTVENLGNNTYTSNFTVIDSLPAGLEFIETLSITGATNLSEVHNGQNITWILTNIKPKSNATIVVLVKVNAIGNLTNNLTVVGPRNSTDMVNCTINPIPLVDLSVNITSDKDEYFVDDVAVWTIVVSNADNATNATNVTLKDLFPSDNFKFINCTDSNGKSYNLTDGGWVIPVIANGTNITFTVYSQAVTPGNDIDNTAEVNCTEKEWDYANNNATKSVNVVPLPRPVKEVSNHTPYYHEELIYNLTVVNVGSGNYTDNLTVIDSLPVGLKFIETISVTGAAVLSEVPDGQVITWTLTNITKGSATITIRVKVNAIGNLTNNLTVVGPRGNETMVNCTVDPMPIVDISVNITSDKVEYFVDDVAVWTITVSNADNATNASNINLSGLLPDEFVFMHCDLPNGTVYNETTGIWTIPSLANGTNVTLVIYADAHVPGDGIVYPVNASCAEDEWNYTNNDDKKVVDIISFHKPDKEVSNSTPYYHEYVNYTLTVQNMGNFMYTSNFTVIDSLPAGLEFIRTLNITGAKNISEVHDGQKITWILTNIPAKSNATIVILVKVNGVGDLTNNLTVIGPRNATDMVDCTINPMTLVDISVNITSDKVEYFVDDVAAFTITVSNAANGTNASNIKLSELLPDEFEYMYCDAANGTVYNETTGIWTIPGLANGTNVTLVIYAHAKVPASNIVNEVNASCSDKEWDYTNNDDDVVVDIISFHKPAKIVSNSTPYYHEYVNYTMTVENLGNFMYTSNFTVIDSLPAGLEFIRTLNITGAKNISEVHDGQKITWILTNIPAKSNATIVILVKVNAIGDLTNNLTVVGPRNATDMVDCTINPMPIVDISVNITSDKDEYFVDDVAVWTITVSNAANGTNASNINLSGLLPDEFVFMHCDLPNGTVYNETTGIWTIPSLANGTNVTLVIYADAHVPGDGIVYPVNASCAEDEWNYTNNDDKKVVDIISFHKPEKTVSNSTPYYHEYVNYTLTVQNMGNFMYTSNFTVIDSLPAGLEFIRTLNITGAKNISEVKDGQVVTWILTNIPAKSNATIIILVKVNAIGDLTNNLTVVGPRNATDMVNCTINPMPIVDLSVNITSDKDEYFVDDVATWTIIISNAANATNATNVSLKDLLPAEFEFIDCTLPEGTVYNETTGIWTIGDMANGTNLTLTITSRAVTPAKDIVNVVNATCSEDEWNYANNEADKTVTIVDLPYPVKTVDNSTPNYHDTVEYNLTIVNTGTNAYVDNLTVIDSLPNGLQFIETVAIKGAKFVGDESVDGQTVTWIITNITDSATITVRVKVNAVGNLTNNLTIVGPNGTEKTVNCTINPVPVVDISVNITTDKNVYFVGDVVAVTVTVSNDPNSVNATEVALSHFIPPQFEFINCTTENGTFDPVNRIWKIGDLENGTSVTMVVYLLANETGIDIDNAVEVKCAQKELNITNNVDNKLVNVVPLPLIEKTVNTTTPYNKEFVEYYLTVKNIANTTYINNLTVIDVLPAELIFNKTISISGADLIGETEDGKKVTWIITNISAKSEAVITVKVFVNDIGNLTNNLTVIGPNGDNDTVNCTITPIPVADLEIIKNVSTTIPHKNDIIIWKITVTNNGPDTAINTKVTDKLPSEVVYVSDDSLNNYNSKSGIWNVGDLAGGESKTLTIKARVVKTNTTITNFADVKSDTYDPNETNNRCSNSTDVPPEADLSITVKPDITEVRVGDEVVYTITVLNDGPDTAENTTASIKIPKELELLGYEPSQGTYDPETGTWDIGDVPPGEEVTLILKTRALVDGKIIVEASVRCDTYESDLSNNNASCEITVLPEEEPPAEGHELPKMHATGNPIAMVVLALLAAAGASIRRKI